MTLQDAIDKVKKSVPIDEPWSAENISGDYPPDKMDYAIATILNAVVKGELKHVES